MRLVQDTQPNQSIPLNNCVILSVLLRFYVVTLLKAFQSKMKQTTLRKGDELKDQTLRPRSTHFPLSGFPGKHPAAAETHRKHFPAPNSSFYLDFGCTVGAGVIEAVFLLFLNMMTGHLSARSSEK